MIVLPNISPVIFSIGSIDIRWYSLAYIVGMLLGLYIVNRLSKEPLDDNLLLYAVLGVIIGGRLGYVLFYGLPYYISNPADIMQIWNGGMSFHGGLVGLATSMYLFTKKYKIKYLEMMDLVAVVAPIGLFLGRIANFINAELFGRATNVAWGVMFEGDEFARHPSQIYEALTEGLLLFIILIVLAKCTKIRDKRGALSGIFLIGYSTFRTAIEFFRMPDQQIGLVFDFVSMGQILCVPMFMLGAFLILYSKRRGSLI